MADLLTHVLVPYIILTVAGWRIDRITDRWIVVGMAGAMIPDLSKVRVVFPPGAVRDVLGVPFSYFPISTLGGVIVIAGIVTLLFRERRRAFGFLLFGGSSALLLDGMRAFADGRSDFWLYPFLWWRPPTPGVYVSSDLRVMIVVVVIGVAIYLFDRQVVD